MRLPLLLLVVLAVALTWNAPALAAGGTTVRWQGAQKLQTVPTSSVGEPVFAANGSGAAVFAWWANVGNGVQIFATTRSPGQPFGAPQAVATLPSTASVSSVQPAIDAAGDVVVVWGQNASAGTGKGRLRAVYRRAGKSSFAKPQLVYTAGVQNVAVQFDVAVADDGTAIVVTELARADGGGVLAIQRPQRGKWSVRQQIGRRSTVPELPLVTVTSNDEIVATWAHSTKTAPPLPSRIQAASAPAPGERFGRTDDVTRLGGAGGASQMEPQALAADGKGNVWLAFVEMPAQPPFLLHVASRPGSGSFGRVTRIASPSDPDVALTSDTAGNLVASWTQAGSSPLLNDVVTRTKPAGKRWRKPRSLHRKGLNESTSIATSAPGGGNLVGFDGQSGVNNPFEAANVAVRAQPGSAFGPLSSAFSGPGFLGADLLGLSLDDSRRALAVGRQLDSSETTTAIVAAQGNLMPVAAPSSRTAR
jgi:hypothetical protein